jgi:hypothetical protein
MGRLDHGQEQFFYSFRLDQVVPDDHLVREIAAVLDLTWTDPAHRCLLVATRPACRNPELESAAAHRVRYDPSASLENRRTFHRAR